MAETTMPFEANDQAPSEVITIEPHPGRLSLSGLNFLIMDGGEILLDIGSDRVLRLGRGVTLDDAARGFVGMVNAWFRRPAAEREQELLEANNRYLERARAAEAKLIAPVASDLRKIAEEAARGAIAGRYPPLIRAAVEAAADAIAAHLSLNVGTVSAADFGPTVVYDKQPAPPSASAIREAAAERPEDRAEAFIQAAVDSAPDPLRRLGEWLANKLDEDDWRTAERMLLGAATASRPVPHQGGEVDSSIANHADEDPVGLSAGLLAQRAREMAEIAMKDRKLGDYAAPYTAVLLRALATAVDRRAKPSDAGSINVPASAVHWLLGQGPDDHGYDFGDGPDASWPGKFWWRRTFTRMIGGWPSPPPQAYGKQA